MWTSQTGFRGESSVNTEEAPNKPKCSFVNLNGLKNAVLYICKGVTLLPPSVVMFTVLFDMICTGKVKYISRVEFGFYANC